MKKNNKKDKVIEYVSFGHEVYKNLFSGLLFKLKENEKNIKNNHVMFGKDNNNNSNEINLIEENDSAGEDENDNIHNIIISNINNKNKIKNKIDNPNNFPELKTTEDGSLIFAIDGFNDENILRTANALNKALNKINDEVNINTFLKIYRLFAEFRWALACCAKFNLKLSRQNDIYNYHKYFYETEEKIQTKKFYDQEATEINTDSYGENILQETKKNVVNKEDHICFEYEKQIQEYKWPWWQIFLWLLGIIPGLIHEIWRRCKIAQLEEYISEMEKSDLFFVLERQLVFLQANEVFFKNMILKSNDPKFLKQMEGKSINTFLRENSNLVNSVERYEFKKSSNSIDIDDSGTIAYKKNIPTDSSGKKLAGGMENTHRININGKNYFTKEGKLFLDSVNSETNEKDTEEYRGNFDKENWAKDEKTQLIDTASHGCIMKAFDNFLGLNVLVDTKLIVTPDGYDVFMKSANGKNAGDIFWEKSGFNTDERYRSFLKDNNFESKKQNRLNKLKNDLLSPELQDAIIKINFLDYLCTNRDRYSTNLFVWKNGLCGIDNEVAFFTGKDWNKQAWALCIKEDLPNLIPYATQELYKIAKSLIDDKNTDKLVDIYKIFAKTANE